MLFFNRICFCSTKNYKKDIFVRIERRWPKPPCKCGGLRPPHPLRKCTIAIAHACTMTIVHTCTMIIVHTCTIAVGHFCRGSGGRSPPVLQGVRGAQPPAFAGGMDLGKLIIIFSYSVEIKLIYGQRILFFLSHQL